MTRDEQRDQFRTLARAVLQKYEREAATRRALSLTARLPTVRDRRLPELERQLEHDGTLLDGALEELAAFLFPSHTPGGTAS